MQPDEHRDVEPNSGGPAGQHFGAGFPIVHAPPLARAVAVDSPDLRMTLIFARGKRDIPWWLAILELLAAMVVGILFSVVAVPVMLACKPVDERWLYVVASLSTGLGILVACVVTLKLERRPLSTIGLTLRSFPLNVLIGMGGCVFIYVALAMLVALAFAFIPQAQAHDQDSVKAIKETFPSMSLPGTVIFMFLVATWEEVAFRGFLLTRLQAIFKRWWLSLPVGAVLFGLGHGYQGPVAMPMIMVLGGLLGLLFWWRKSLVPCIALHALFNIVNAVLASQWTSDMANS